MDSKSNLLKLSLLENNKDMVWSSLFKNWKNSEEFRIFFNSILKCSPFDEYYMRFPEVSKKTLNKSFYFNLIKTTFNKPTDSQTFKKYFKKGKKVVSFNSKLYKMEVFR